jgi:hypothetical protein
MLLQSDKSKMKVSRSQAGLQAHSFGEGSRRAGELALLRQYRTEIVPEVGALGSEIHCPLQL